MPRSLAPLLAATTLALAVACRPALADLMHELPTTGNAIVAQETGPDAVARAAAYPLVLMRSVPTHDVATLGVAGPVAAALPEPATIALLAIALLAIVAILRMTRGRKGRNQRRHQPPLPPA